MVKRLLFIIIVLSLSLFNSSAQSPSFSWAKAIGGFNYDYSYSIALDVSNNVYTTGYFNGTVDFDPGTGIFYLSSTGTGKNIFISKLNSAGNFLWAKTFEGIGNNGGHAIAIDPTESSDIYITGTFSGTVDFDPSVGIYDLTSIGTSDIFISQFDSSGRFVWANSFGGLDFENVMSMAIDPLGNGDVYLTGNFGGTVDFDPGVGVFNLTSASTSDIFILKLNKAGNFIWAKRIGEAGLDVSTHITLDPSGNGDIYTIGSFEGTVDFDPDSISNFNLTSSGNYDIFISKLNNLGDFVWAKQIGGTGFDQGMSITLHPSGNGDIYLTGKFQGIVDFDPNSGIFNITSAGDYDIFISKLDNSGNFVWAKSMGGISYDYSYSIAVDILGNVYTTGLFNGTADFDPNLATTFNLTSAGNNDVFISKLDNSGNFEWAERIGGVDPDIGLDMVLDSSENLFLTGVFYSPSVTFGLTTLTNTINFGSTCDIFVAKLDNIINGMEVIKKDEGIIIYPNPVTGHLTFKFQENKKIIEITITDLTGKIIRLQSPITNTINVFDLSKGVYFIKIKQEDSIIIKKFVKQ